MGLTANHEVKSLDGYKEVHSVVVGDTVNTFNEVDRVAEWKRVTSVTFRIARPGETLYRFSNDRFDAVCDADHLWLLNYRRNDSNIDRMDRLSAHYIDTRLSNWKNNLVSNKYFVPVAAPNCNPVYMWEAEADMFPPGWFDVERNRLDWCRFVGFIMGDGGVLMKATPGATGRVTWSQSYNKPEMLEWLDCLLDRLYISLPDIFNDDNLLRRRANDMMMYTLKCEALWRWFLPMIQGPWNYDPIDFGDVTSYCHSWYRTNHKLWVDRPDAYFKLKAGRKRPGKMIVGRKKYSKKPIWKFVWKNPMRLGDWQYLRRSLLCYDWPLLLDVMQARAFLEGFAAADGNADRLIDSLGGDDSPLTVPMRGSLRLGNSSLPLIHDLMDIATLANARSTITNYAPAGVFESSFRNLTEVTCNAARFRITIHLDEFYTGIPRPIPFTVDRPTRLYTITTEDNGNYLARRCHEYITGAEVPTLKPETKGLRPFYTCS